MVVGVQVWRVYRWGVWKVYKCGVWRVYRCSSIVVYVPRTSQSARSARAGAHVSKSSPPVEKGARVVRVVMDVRVERVVMDVRVVMVPLEGKRPTPPVSTACAEYTQHVRLTPLTTTTTYRCCAPNDLERRSYRVTPGSRRQCTGSPPERSTTPTTAPPCSAPRAPPGTQAPCTRQEAA